MLQGFLFKQLENICTSRCISNFNARIAVSAFQNDNQHCWNNSSCTLWSARTIQAQELYVYKQSIIIMYIVYIYIYVFVCVVYPIYKIYYIEYTIRRNISTNENPPADRLFAKFHCEFNALTSVNSMQISFKFKWRRKCIQIQILLRMYKNRIWTWSICVYSNDTHQNVASVISSRFRSIHIRSINWWIPERTSTIRMRLGQEIFSEMSCLHDQENILHLTMHMDIDGSFLEWYW